MTQVIEHGNPLLYDKIAQELNDKLYLLGHIDDLYPVCFTGYDDEDTYPEVYVNDGTKVSLRVLPDSTKSLSFFTVIGDMTELEEYHMEVSMGYCVWMNLQKVAPAKKYDFTTEIIRDCFNTLRDYGCYDLVVDVNTPFDGFTQLSNQLTANLMRPYSGFKISFNKTIDVCQS